VTIPQSIKVAGSLRYATARGEHQPGSGVSVNGMSSHPGDRKLFERYLGILGVRSVTPGIETLSELVAAQLHRVPYETISKLYYFKRGGLKGMPALEQYLAGIEDHHFGGTCYSNNYYFYRLLEHLGFDVRLCEADMTIPGVHVVSVVTVGDREFLVDVGYAAPFSQPLALDLHEDQVIELGRDRYILKPRDTDRCFRMEMYRNGKPKQGYRVRPVARRIEDFREVIEASYRPDARFMKSILLARFFSGRSTVIFNRTLAQSRDGGSAIQALPGHDAIASSIKQHFGIPAGIVREVIADLSLDAEG
jgi:arylamine N-acetyltransferase